jgi:hypothetical protein
MLRKSTLALAALGCALSASAWADFRAEYEVVKGGNDDTPMMSRIELSGSQMRTDTGKMSMLVDTAAGKYIMLMHDKHQYMDMQKMAETAGAAMSQAQAALANLPPEQRAMIEQQMKAHMPSAAKADISVTPTGASDHVGGIACQIYRTQINGRHVDDACLADVADSGINAADRATLHQAFAQMKAMTEKMSAGMVKSPLNAMPADKFPVRITHFDDAGNATHVVQLKNIAAGGVGSADFTVPAGYTEQDMSSMGRRH